MLRQLARGVSTVALGTALGQGTILLATPWLARLYAPSDFGALAIMVTISNIATAAACLRYDLALPSCDNRHARPLLIVALACALGISIAVFCVDAVLVVFSHASLRAPFNRTWAAALCVALVGTYQVTLAWVTRAGAFGRVAAIRFAQGFCFSGLAAVHFIGLVLAHVLSFGAALPTLWRAARARTGQQSSIVETARRYRQFPCVSLPGALLDVVGYSFCIWIISNTYGSADAGQFAQIQRVVGAPLMLTGVSLGQVLLRHSADVMRDTAQLQQLFSRVSRGLALLGAVVVLLTAACGEPLLHWLLGRQWRVNVSFITPIALAVAVRACASPLSTILITLRRFDLALYWQVAYFASAVTVLRFLASHLNFGTFVITYAAHECVFYSVYVFLIQSAIRSSRCVASSA